MSNQDYERGVRDERERIIRHLEATKHFGYPNIQVRLLFEELRWFMAGERKDNE
jgi:hypothetical protein